MNYYLARDYKSKRISDAGSKARLDIERIMDRLGFRPAGKTRTVSRNKLNHFVRTLTIVACMLLRVRKGDLLAIQYPAKYYETVCRMAHMNGAHVVTFVHDLECFRQKHNTVKHEIRRMNMSDGVIGCNPVVCKWLLDNGFVGHGKSGAIEPLYVFDFLSDSVCRDRKDTWPLHKVLYAGQLAYRKNSFLYQYGDCIKGYTVNIYGSGFDKSTAACPDKFDVKGFMFSDELIKKAEGDFGLVWDGDSIDCCSGNWGEYLAVNTPHKISLYVRCGLPIIIWSKAAMAGFVKENGIGLCVDSLHDISGIYERLTKDEYDRMCDNVQRVGRMMSEGWYFSRAMSEIVPRISR